MFKPTNPEIETLKLQIEKNNIDIQNLDNTYEEIENTKNIIKVLKNRISEINSKISSLTKQRKDTSKKISILKKKINGKSLNELYKQKTALQEENENKKVLIQNLIDLDFKTFINTMTEANTLSYYLCPNTKTTPIMDEFCNDKEKDFLVFSGVFPDKDLVITRKQNVSIMNVSSPTMTELKTCRSTCAAPERMAPLLEEIKKYDDFKMKYGQKIQFNKPFPLGGQTYANQTGYGWEWDWTYGIGTYIIIFLNIKAKQCINRTNHQILRYKKGT